MRRGTFKDDTASSFSAIIGMAVGPDGDRVYVATVSLPGDDAYDVIGAINGAVSLGVVHVIDTVNHTISDSITVDGFQAAGPLSNIGVSADGSRIYVSGISLAVVIRTASSTSSTPRPERSSWRPRNRQWRVLE